MNPIKINENKSILLLDTITDNDQRVLLTD
jgi:hypothetical protein